MTISGSRNKNCLNRRKKQKPPGSKPGGYGVTPVCRESRQGPLRDLEVFRGGFAAVADEFVLDDLSLVEGAEASALDGRDMDEHVFIPGRGLDEPIALSWIEPFDGAFLHRLSPRSVRT